MDKRTERSAPAFWIAAGTVAAVVLMAALGIATVWLGAVGLAGVIAGALFRPAAAPPAPPVPLAPATAAEKAAPPGDGEPFCLPSDEQERSLMMAGELAAAREIQMRLVPHTFPPLTDCPPFDLYAMIEPAREIGGDFYDYWMLGRERLALVVADVSGKGVPAALYMAMTRTYLRAFSRYIHEPAELLTRLNREVARHNPGNMFVTVFCAVIDMTTGRMEYANAGHNPPLRKKRGQNAEFFELAGNPPVGFVPGHDFRKMETQLDPGEMLLFYTDGVSEAMDPAEAMLGEDRMAEIFNEAAAAADSCRAVTMHLQSELAEFMAGAERYDDITIMTYRHPDQDDWTVSGEYESEAAGGDAALASFGSVALTGGSDAASRFFSLSDLK